MHAKPHRVLSPDAELRKTGLLTMMDLPMALELDRALHNLRAVFGGVAHDGHGLLLVGGGCGLPLASRAVEGQIGLHDRAVADERDTRDLVALHELGDFVELRDGAAVFLDELAELRRLQDAVLEVVLELFEVGLGDA